MKKLLFLTLALALSVTQVTRADNDNQKKKHKRQAEEASEPVHSPQAARPVARKPVQQQAQRPATPVQRGSARAPGTVASEQRQPVRTEAQLDGRNRAPVSTSRNRGDRNLNPNSFNVARTRVIRTPHNRNWWRNRFNTTFVLFGGGYYYWWNGYWYPAYGYDPYYNNYAYGEPIYGYNDLAPGQVIENVQIALRNEGYYPGAIDGLVGPQTRAALAAYQRDHGLVITSAVDEPTLVTLGLA